MRSTRPPAAGVLSARAVRRPTGRNSSARPGGLDRVCTGQAVVIAGFGCGPVSKQASRVVCACWCASLPVVQETVVVDDLAHRWVGAQERGAAEREGGGARVWQAATE